VDTKTEIREFLTSRRARITPEQAGLASYGSRRVPGLRREEVAVLAGVSVPYYTRLERGDMNGVSDSVLQALAGALRLDEAERAHLFDLARAANPTPARSRRRHAKQRVRPELQWTLDAITGAAAFVSNERLDVLAANQLGRALFSELYATPVRPVNTARFLFLDPRAEASYGDWDRVATETVAILRSAAGRDPYDRDLSDLIGELATQSDDFRTRWAAHNVRFHNTGVKNLNHPVVGKLQLSFNRLDLAADHGLTLVTYTAEPGSRSEEALKLLGSWAATVDDLSQRGLPTRAEAGLDPCDAMECGRWSPSPTGSGPRTATPRWRKAACERSAAAAPASCTAYGSRRPGSPSRDGTTAT
jgi:transcriptional regulator with XRE-family HTH domain